MEELHRNLCQLFPDNPCRLVSKQIEFEVTPDFTVKITEKTFGKSYYAQEFEITGPYQIFLESFQRCLDDYQRIEQLKSTLQPLFDFYKVNATIDCCRYVTLKFEFRDISFTTTTVYTGKSSTSIVDYGRGIFQFIALDQDNCIDNIKNLFTQQILKYRIDYLCEEYLPDILDVDNLIELVFNIVNQQTELLILN